MTSVKIFSVSGIPIELDFSFLLLMLFIYILAYLGFLSVNLAVLITLVFVTVVIHELAHSYVALRFGVKIKSILLLPIGGVSRMEEIPRIPRQEFMISIAGPLTNILMALITAVPLLFGLKGAAATFAGDFLAVNLLLAIFNLIPAFPMDGGRILRAILAERLSYIRATRIASNLGKIIAVLMAVTGLFYNFFLILIGFFIYIGAEQEYQATLISSLLEGVRVADVMTENPVTLHPHMTVKEALDVMFREKHMGYPVTEAGELRGIVTFHDISDASRDLRVEDVMTGDVVTVRDDEEVTGALEKMNRLQLGRLPVMREGKLTGIISRTDIVRTLNLMNKKTE
ncbi:CBS domain-containing protein [Methanothermobacter thermautotrophicus]|uniref:CBS domain-containing protein n=1 Tax=Methanothermobacter thermautotrophicus TaxID=145262 RepID=UPI0022B96A15|nr:M50 family metallopeptidase [Methanothermobacter thermautotrophicus]WBF08835.1 CBS domain-containing protein [Methanothermobacter thermautotrophicus]